MRYPRVGGRRERRFAGTSFKPHKLPENAVTPTRRVHAVLGAFVQSISDYLNQPNNIEIDNGNNVIIGPSRPPSIEPIYFSLFL